MKKAPSKNKTGRPAGGGKSTVKGDKPMRKDQEVKDSNDEHIDQDFPNFPHHPSHRETIHNGSAGAFDATEHSHDEEDEDQDSDDFAMER